MRHVKNATVRGRALAWAVISLVIVVAAGIFVYYASLPQYTASQMPPRFVMADAPLSAKLLAYNGPSNIVPADLPLSESKKSVPVSISHSSFGPEQVTVSKGMTVVWFNYDSALHSIVLDDGTAFGSVIKKGEQASHTFIHAGTYRYHCGLHPSLWGTIIVK